ncbi:hypothetical protein B566_EDAN014954 [Ephemera danica]|nr:hypothetical protein B566_EDAN014954 [Ephemera danica]
MPVENGCTEGTKENPLFDLECFLIAGDIQLCARSEIGRRQILALVTGSNELVLYYTVLEKPLPVIKQIPWLLDSGKKIVALCFDPSGTWLLVAGCDGSLFVVPALSLVDPSAALDHRWRGGDITELPLTPGTSRPTPSALVWWHNLDGQHVAVLGSAQGHICFVSLTSGADLGRTGVPESVEDISLCQDNNLDSVFILITGPERRQWKLTLEQRSAGYCWPLERSALDMGLDADALPGTCLVPLPARSRLQGLKQLSVEKLATLKQKLAETRKSGSLRKDSSAEDIGVLRSRSGNSVHDNSISEETPCPERVSSDLGYFLPQYARGRYLLSGFYPNTQLLKILPMNVTDEPLYVHKLPPGSGCQLYTDRFLFVWELKGTKLSIISCQLSEIRPDREKDHNVESVIQKLDLTKGEHVLAVYKRTESQYYSSREEPKSSTEAREAHIRRLHALVAVPTGGSVPTPTELPQSIRDLKIDIGLIRVLKIISKISNCSTQSPAELFMELALEREELERAERLALLFGLNVKQLLEAAGDLKLAARQFPQAIMLYKLSRCRHLKSVLKFAKSGHSAELLSFVEVLLSASDIDLSVSEKMHLSNLSVMAHMEQVLRATGGLKSTLYSKFLCLMRDNLHYDEVLAVSVAGQTGLWDILLFLSSHRGLRPEVLDVLLKVVNGITEPQQRRSPHKFPLVQQASSIEHGMWLCLSDAELLQALILKPKAAKIHMQFVSGLLPTLDPTILERLAMLYNPSSPKLRMLLRKVLSKRQRLYSNSSGGAFSHLESLDYSEPDENPVPVQEMIELFICILLHLIRKQSMAPTYLPHLMGNIKLPSLKQDDCDDPVPMVPLQCRPLGAGFAHAGVIRNGTPVMWGNLVQGCLGAGPSMSRYGTPQIVNFFPTLRIEVLSVACGKNHSLALTSNGVYAWGSSQFGQLGVGKTGQSPHPRLVEKLTEERVVSISAGQYHSLALTEEGRVFSWGWGVHGQLGHGSIEDEIYPRLIQGLYDKTVTQIAGAHGHSTVLTSCGEVWAFGSGVFGQLGTSLVNKKSIPIPVNLPENIRLIASSYFHNLAVGESNSMYTWGSSYQVLRLQAQAQKRARAIHDSHMFKAPQTIVRANNTGNKDVLSPDIPSPITPERGLPGAPPTSPSASQPMPVSVEAIASPVVEIPPVVPNGVGPPGMRSIDPAQLQSIEESIGQQALFAPVKVDTSQVMGKIVQMWCGYHHSCLITEGGTLHTWGRSLDGQLGNGARKEVPIPIPLQSLADRQITHAACGADFTLALEKSGTVFIWGSNSLGQLGTVPQDDGKALEGKYVKFKTTKRIIKLPHGKQNSCDLPCELSGLPSASIPFSALNNNITSNMGLPKVNSMYPLERLEQPPLIFGSRTLHAALEQFYGHYDQAKILALCTDLEIYQAAAKLCSLEHHYHLALAYQLKALSLGCSNQTSTTTSSVSSPEFPSSPEKPKPKSEETQQPEIHSFAIQGGQEEMIERYLEGEELVPERQEQNQCSPIQEEAESPKSNEEKVDNEAPEHGKQQQNEFAVEASSIVEHYVSLMEAESHTMMRRLLEQGIEFWLSHSLPVDQLENLLMKHIKGNGVEGEEQQAMQILSHLSTRFCLQLCKTLLSHINQSTEDLVFSCGHQYEADSFRRSVLPELELGLLRLHRPLPTTARVLKGLFGEGPSVKLACPLCVLRHLQAQQAEDQDTK